jgi:hypothetical protein
MRRQLAGLISATLFTIVLAGCSSWMADKSPTPPPVDSSLPGAEAASSSSSM